MDGSAPSHRELCLRCRRPRSVCWCDALRPVQSRTRVVFLQHPREARVPVSTCRMAHLSLPNSELHVGLRAQGDAQLEAACARPGTAVLFPSAHAVDVATLAEPPRTLIVVDGTWSNAKKVVEKCPLLSKLPRLAFTPARPGNYRIRKEPAEHCLSTIEAVTYVLEALERAPGAFTPMLSVFDAMVERQLEYIARNGHRTTRHKRARKRNAVRRDPLTLLREEAARLVVLFGEANAWPADDAARPAGARAELIQLVACRLSSGERFEALLRPSGPLSPSAAFHLELPEEAVARGEPRADALARWRGFLREGDVLVGWGTFCKSLLTAEGLEGVQFVNLRGVLAAALGRRPGSVEAVAARLGTSSLAGRGRAARRLEALRVACLAAVGGTAERALAEP